MKNILKSERGSVSLYALIAMLILLVILLNMYIYNAQRQAQNLEITKQIKSTYEQEANQVNQVYENLTSQ